MDVVLEALDHVNAMFDQVRNREEPTPAPDELIAALDELAKPEGDTAAPATPEPEPAAGAGNDSGDITDEEFEQLLDALADEKGAEQQPAAAPENTSANDAGSDGDEITDDEFEALLDQLHGKGQFAGPPAVDNDNPAEPEPEEPAKSSTGDDLITDDEFENLLDELHGKGKSPGAAPGAATKPEPAAKPEPKKPEPKQPESAKQEAKPAAAAPARDAAPAAETTVRVDTKRLDDIMNMVGELVLVRNRLQRLGSESEDEHMHKAVANLDVVTTDLQAAVMQTRMQPIKKVFGRFPRVVRDLARNLKKEVNLVMHGEETDLDKNLVEALSDPLVHLVRNSVDHGIEAPDIREKAGKPLAGTVTLSAEQEGDHILLSIDDDGAGMDPEVLRRKAVEKGIYDQDAADRLTDTDRKSVV